MFMQLTRHAYILSRNLIFTPVLFMSSALICSSAQFMAAVESIPTTPVDQVPETIRTQLVQVTGGAKITDVKVDSTHGEKRYIAHYRDSASKEMRTVTVGQMGNVIEPDAVSGGDHDNAVGVTGGVKPGSLKPVPSDQHEPVTLPQRPIAPVIPDAPVVANAPKDLQADPPQKSLPTATVPPTTQTGATDNNSKPFGIPQKEENRDSSKSTDVVPKNNDTTAPGSQKSASPKKP